jgi:hypothetical protein
MVAAWWVVHDDNGWMPADEWVFGVLPDSASPPAGEAPSTPEDTLTVLS